MTTQIGIAHTFDYKVFIECAKQLIDADEVERALAVLDNLPAYFRDHLPAEIIEYRNKILAHMITAHGYINDNHDCNINNDEAAKWLIDNTLRGQLLQKEVDAADKPCYIVDVGPGEYWIPKGIKGDFTYKPIAMDQRVYEQAAKDPDIAKRMFEPEGADPIKIFVALEVIEHISNPRELAWECAKHFGCEEPDYIHLSTPMYTYDSKPKDWASHKLPHLRAYTPREFIVQAQNLWPHYEWQFYPSAVMSLRGLHPRATNRQSLF